MKNKIFHTQDLCLRTLDTNLICPKNMCRNDDFMNKDNKTIRDARTLGLPKMLLLGLQHMFAMFGATILVPILVNNYFNGEELSVQVTLFLAGIGTLFFHLCTKLKVPAFLGSSFAFLGGFETVAKLDTGIFKNMTMGEKLPYACGGIVVAGLLYLVLALIIRIGGQSFNVFSAAVYAAVLSFVPKFAAIISTMPVAIVGGVSFIFYSLSVVDKHFLTFMFTMDIQINLK